MFAFLVDLLMMLAVLVAGWHRETRAGADPRAASADSGSDAPPGAPHRSPPVGSTRRPYPTSAVAPTLSNGPDAGYLSDVTVTWTALDDHQLTRLLKQSAS
jgi:hypothetical protein